MVYNALKLFMEINPDLFDECLQGYKENRIHERAQLTQRYDNWQRMREAAIETASRIKAKCPDSVLDASYPPPPPTEDPDISEIAIDLSQAVIEAEATEVNLDDSGGMERVPTADLGFAGGEAVVSKCSSRSVR
jgi:serine/threonine-protein phosphatase 2A regulatory subunit B'